MKTFDRASWVCFLAIAAVACAFTACSGDDDDDDDAPDACELGGDCWVVETVWTAEGDSLVFTPVTAMTPENQPAAVFYGSGVLHYARLAGGSWDVEAIPSSQPADLVPTRLRSLRYDSSGAPLVAFAWQVIGDVEEIHTGFGRKGEDGWVTEKLDGGGRGDLAIAPGGGVGMVAYDFFDYYPVAEFVYLVNDGEGWTTHPVEVDDPADQVYDLHLFYDADGEASVIYDRDSDAVLYAHQGPGGWRFETIVSNESTLGSVAGLHAIKGEGASYHIVYAATTGRDLEKSYFYAHGVPDSWTIERIVGQHLEGDRVLLVGIDVDRIGRVHMLAKETNSARTSYHLYYAVRGPGGEGTWAVEDTGIEWEYAAGDLVLDDDGVAHVVAADRQTVYYLRRKGPVPVE